MLTLTGFLMLIIIIVLVCWLITSWFVDPVSLVEFASFRQFKNISDDLFESNVHIGGVIGTCLYKSKICKD